MILHQHSLKFGNEVFKMFDKFYWRSHQGNDVEIYPPVELLLPFTNA